MHHTLVLILLLLLGFSPVQSRSVKAFIEGSPEETENTVDNDDLSVSAIIERANKNIGKSLDDPTIQFGDIAVNDGLQNAAQCLFREPGCKWPKSRDGKVYVPYFIDYQYSPEEKNLIENVLRTFDNITCIRFRPRINEEGFIYILPQQGCFSYVGRTGTPQVLSLGRNSYSSCLYKHVIQHELLHALGFHHEHNRSDRDQHVRIIYQNIQPGLEYAFEKANTNNLGTPYDYASIMHYQRDAFTRNGQPTIIPIPNNNVAIGRSTEMNASDILRIKKVYCGGP